MYEQIKSLKGPLVGLHIKSDISDANTRQIIELIQQRFQAFGPVRLLVLYTAPPGMIGAESLYDNMRFAKLTSDKLHKMAVIGKHDWDDTWIGLFGLFGGIQTSYFPKDQYEEALAWLAES